MNAYSELFQTNGRNHHHHCFGAANVLQYSGACQSMPQSTKLPNSNEGIKNHYGVWHGIDSYRIHAWVLGLESYRLWVTMAIHTFGPRLRNENQLCGNLARFKKFCLKINISDFGRSAKICRQKIQFSVWTRQVGCHRTPYFWNNLIH